MAKKEEVVNNPIVHRLPKDGRYEGVRFVFVRHEEAGACAIPTIAVETMRRDSQQSEAWTPLCRADDHLADFGLELARSPAWKHEAVTRDEVLAALFATLMLKG